MNIAVIGAGIGGLATAIFLSRLGHQITVYEQAETASPVGAGFLLQPPGQAVLKKLGVFDQISKEAIPIQGLRSRTLSGVRLLDLSYSDLKGVPRTGLGIQRSNIFGALYDAALRIDSIHFKWGSRVSACRSVGEGAEVFIDESRVSHDLCILSSGTHSPLADSVFPERRKLQFSWGCLWATLNLPDQFETHLLQQRCRRADKMMGVLPIRKHGGQCQAALYWSLPIPFLERLNESQFPSIKNEIMDFWPELSDSVDALEYPDFTAAAYNEVWIPKPYSGRVLAIGDVCHGTSPQLGQGCTMALLDALSLATYMDEKDLDASLARWWSTRKNQLSFIRHISRFLTPLYQSDQTAYSLFRDRLVAPMGRMPGLYQLQLKTLASEVFLNKQILD